MHWQLKRTMSDAEFRRAIKQLNLSRAACARYLGISNSTAYRYAERGANIPVTVALLLNAVLEMGVEPIVPPWKRQP